MIVGLTGNIACGKTSAAIFFSKLGAYVIEADKIARNLTAKDTPQFNEILKYFGNDILDSEGHINRRRLGQIVFANKEKLKVLNKILHPPTIELIKQEIKKKHKSSVIIIESALLFETELKELVQKIIVVRCARNIQLSRLEKKGLSLKEGKERQKAQLSMTYKIKNADFIIDNNKDLINLSQQVQKIWIKLNHD